MILVDTSAWIEHARRNGHAGAKQKLDDVIRAGHAAACGLVYVEFWAYITDVSEQRTADAAFPALHWLETGTAEYKWAVTNGRLLRKKGITVPPSDLVIAATAIRYGVQLAHADTDFTLIAKHTDLKQRDLREE